MTWKFSKGSVKNRKGVREELILVNDRALEISRFDFGIPDTGGKRSAKLQHNLYLKGLSNADGYNDISDHQLGKALDFFGYDGRATWDLHVLAVIAAAHLQAASEFGIKLGWGGLWKTFPDYPHIYLLE